MKLSLRNLRKVFLDAERELVILEKVTFDFPESGTIGIVGRSGIGKSTLLHILGGLEKATSGEALFGEIALSGLSSDALSDFRSAHVGFIFQFHHLLPEFSALENVMMPLLIQGMDEKEARERASSLLNRVGLSSRSHHFPSRLSGGEQQRVAIARALVGKPAVVLADEPTGSLDVQTAGEIGALLGEVTKEQGGVLIAVTHSPEFAESMDWMFEMKPGGDLIELRRPQ